MPHFKKSERTAVYQFLMKIGQLDDRVNGAALVGSFALNKQDRWSDLDISFGLKEKVIPKEVLEEWTNQLKKEYEIIHFFDVPHAQAIYRVFLFSSGLEVDLSVGPESEFGPKSPSFKLLFGKALDNATFSTSTLESHFGWGWHHVMHANSSLKRKRLWQTVFWIDNLREHIIAIKCLRMELPALQGRGVDQLPEEELLLLKNTLVGSIEVEALTVNLLACVKLLTSEVSRNDKGLANNLSEVFKNALNEK